MNHRCETANGSVLRAICSLYADTDLLKPRPPINRRISDWEKRLPKLAYYHTFPRLVGGFSFEFFSGRSGGLVGLPVLQSFGPEEMAVKICERIRTERGIGPKEAGHDSVSVEEK